MKKALRELAEQYKSDVETRIKAIAEERDEVYNNSPDPEVFGEYEDEIAHWQATLAEINETLKGTV